MAKKIIDIKLPQDESGLEPEERQPVLRRPLRVKLKAKVKPVASYSPADNDSSALPKKEKLLEQKERWLNKKNILFLCSAFLVLFGALLVLSLLGIEVKIWPALTVKSFQDELSADSSITEADFSQKIIPANYLEEEGETSGQFNATEIVPKEIKAEGVIRVYNNYAMTQVLVANTRFLSADEKIFRSKKRVSIPTQGYLDVEVIAAGPGQEYNIGPTTFSVPGLAGSPRYTAVFGKSFKPMEGGILSETVRVSKDDLKEAQNQLEVKLTEQLKEMLLKKADASSMTILEDTISLLVLESSSLVKPGAEIEQFDLTLKMKVKALAVKKDDLKNFAKEIIEQKISQDERFFEDTLKMTLQAENPDLQKSKQKIRVDITAQIYSYIDIGELKNQLLGRKLKEGKEMLGADTRVLAAQVKSLSFWKTKFPRNPKKIEINLMLNQ